MKPTHTTPGDERDGDEDYVPNEFADESMDQD